MNEKKFLAKLINAKEIVELKNIDFTYSIIYTNEHGLKYSISKEELIHRFNRGYFGFFQSKLVLEGKYLYVKNCNNNNTDTIKNLGECRNGIEILTNVLKYLKQKNQVIII